MTLDLGIVKPGSTIYIPWGSFAAATGAPSAMTNLAVGDILIYKNGSVTERSSTTGFTLLDTDGQDFDGKTGINGISIDLSSNADAGFYAAGARYFVVIGDVTIDAQTVRFVLATFEIGLPSSILSTTVATLASQTSFTLTVGPGDDDALNGCVIYFHDVASSVQCGFAYVSDYTGSTKTVTLLAGTVFTVATTDNVMVLPPSNVQAWNGTAVPTQHTAGYPVVTVKDGTGTGEIDTNAGAIVSVTTTATATNVTTVNGLAANVITATSIAADAITAAKIADGAIDAATLASDTITAAKIATGAITSAKFAAGAIDAAAIADNAIDAGALAADCITAAKIADGAIDAATLAADCITAAKVADDVSTEIANKVLDTDMTAHQTQGTLGQAIGDPVADTNTIYKAVVTDATGATVGIDVVAMKVDTAAILVDTGTTLDARIPAALVAGRMDSNAAAINNSTTAANRLQRAAEGAAIGVVGSLSTVTSIITTVIDPAAAVTNQFQGRILVFDQATTTTNLRGQATDITASTSGGVLTVTALTTAPVSGDTFTIQ